MFLVFGEGFLFFSLGFKYLRRKVTLVGLLCTPVGVIANRSPPALVNKVLVSCWFCHFFLKPYMKTCFKFFLDHVHLGGCAKN